MQLEMNLTTSSNTYVTTHLGRVPTSQMGITLVHEHIFNKFHFKRKNVSEEFTIRQLERLRQRGVKTIVDLTPYTSLGDFETIFRSATFINVVSCIGFYVKKYVSRSYQDATVSELVARLSDQIQDGRGRLKIRPGILKVAGWTPEMSPLEKKLFTTIGLLQKEHKLPVATHSPKGALAHLQVLIEAGADPAHIFLSHLDRGLSTPANSEMRFEEILQVLDRGAYVLFSEFGHSVDTKSRSVEAVKDFVSRLKDRKYLSQMLISADSTWRWKQGEICLKNAHWGGNLRTYDYVFTQIVPVLKDIGFTSQDIQTLLVTNPEHLFNCA